MLGKLLSLWKTLATLATHEPVCTSHYSELLLHDHLVMDSTVKMSGEVTHSNLQVADLTEIEAVNFCFVRILNLFILYNVFFLDITLFFTRLLFSHETTIIFQILRFFLY